MTRDATADGQPGRSDTADDRQPEPSDAARGQPGSSDAADPTAAGAPEPSDVVAWVDARLGEAGRRRTGELTVTRRRAWGTVMRAETDLGVVWLKVPAADTAFEVALYPVLHRLAPRHVLAPIAADRALGRLLLPDGGPALRDRYDGEELDAAFAGVLPHYAGLQRALMPAVGELLAIGVVDMRPAVLPLRFEEAVAAASIAGDVGAVREQRAWFGDIAAALAESKVPASIDHADLHTGNVLADGGRIYDWGDSVVGHPFASMLVALRGSPGGTTRGSEDAPARAAAGGTTRGSEDGPARAGTGGTTRGAAGDVDRGRALDAYIECFTDLAPRAELLADLRRARIAGNVIRALTWHRALAAEGYGRAGEFAQAPAVHLRQLLTAQPWDCP